MSLSFPSMDESIRERLLQISPSTIERMLRPIREEMKLKKKYRRNPHSSSIGGEDDEEIL